MEPEQNTTKPGLSKGFKSPRVRQNSPGFPGLFLFVVTRHWHMVTRRERIPKTTTTKHNLGGESYGFPA